MQNDHLFRIRFNSNRTLKHLQIQNYAKIVLVKNFNLNLLSLHKNINHKYKSYEKDNLTLFLFNRHYFFDIIDNTSS